MERILAIGDIHGCFDRVRALLDKLAIDVKRDNVIFLGDYVDRGPDSKKVVDLMIHLQQENPDSYVFLKGNHEEMFLDYVENGPLKNSFLKFGGQETLKSYGHPDPGHIPKQHVEFLKKLKPMHLTDRFCFVHAGLKPGVPIEKQKEEDLLWIRFSFIKSDYDWGKRIIFGHTPFDTPLIEKNKIGIDTGAVYGGRLTCLVLPAVEFIFA